MNSFVVFSDIFVSVGLMMLLTGILTAGRIVVLTVIDSIVPNRLATDGFASFLDLRVGSGLAIGLLLFGILAFFWAACGSICTTRTG